MTAMEHNQEVYDQQAEFYQRFDLMPPERLLLQRFRDSWPRMDMLDLGVGAGRTAYTFAALTRSYVGVDYSPRLIELAREHVGEDERTRFALGDARDLSDLEDASFDLVLFSYNGIDSIDHHGRIEVLAEARRVLRPGGWLYFSAHNLRSLPWRRELRRPSPRAPVRSSVASLKSVQTSWRMAKSNRAMDRAHIEREGWAVVRDREHDFSVDLCYVMPERQVELLTDAGFTVHGVFDRAAVAVDLAAPGRDFWFHYLCQSTGDPPLGQAELT